jgi:hypothetical protein
MRARLKFFLIGAIILISYPDLIAQEVRCISSEKMQEQLLLDPALAERRQTIEEFTQRWIAENEGENTRAVITIPVVVHVVYRTANQNVSDQHIYSQIAVLNEDFRLLNADASNIPSAWNNVKADTEIEFCLAVRDPNGFQTTGITRTETEVVSWNGSDNVKSTALGGKDAWPASQYLNIWVCNIGSGLLGYAYQPGVSASLDGLVIGFQYFGRDVPGLSSTYNKGRTATHEIGHYFNLEHLWGGGNSNPNCNMDDFVADTPRQADPNYGCQTFPHITCENGPHGDMFHNYMDYGRDNCLFFFTNGQKQRMLAALNGPRASLKTSLGCVATNVSVDDMAHMASISVHPNPSSDMVRVSVDNSNVQITSVRLLNLMGSEIMRLNDVHSDNAAILVGQLSAGVYLIEVLTQSGRHVSKIHIYK